MRVYINSPAPSSIGVETRPATVTVFHPCFSNLQEKVEFFVPGSDLKEIKDTLLLSKNYITKLDIRQLLPPVREAPKAFQLDDDDAASDAGKEINHIS